MRVDTLAHRKNKNATTRKLASEVGFCIDDRLADDIAQRVTHRASQHAAECYERVTRLYRGRNAYNLGRRDRLDLLALRDQCKRMIEYLDEILEAQEAAETVTMQAAE